MELRRILLKRRKAQHSGTLICSKCRLNNQFVLWEDSLCKRCFVPKYLDPIYLRPTTNEAPRQTTATLELKARCDALIADLGIARYRFAKLIGCVPSAFDGWHQGRYGQKGQARMGERIENGLKSAGFAEVSA